MRVRTISLLSIVLISLVMVPHMDAAPGGIGTIGDNGMFMSRWALIRYNGNCNRAA